MNNIGTYILNIFFQLNTFVRQVGTYFLKYQIVKKQKYFIIVPTSYYSYINLLGRYIGRLFIILVIGNLNVGYYINLFGIYNN